MIPECHDLDKEWVEEKLGFKVEDPGDIFFADTDVELDPRYLWPKQRRAMTALALELCSRCPTTPKKLCLQTALEDNPAGGDFGIFAGTTAKERKYMRRETK